MRSARVLVIEHQKNAGLGQLSDRLIENGLTLETVGPDTGAPVPESLEGYDALIVLGGAMGPTEDDQAPWLPATRKLLVDGVEQGVPTLGICLGAQLLATATGGHVRTMPAGPEVGLLDVGFDASAAGDPLFGDLAGTSVPAVQWHWLEADRLPESAHVLASSPACRNQAFRIGAAAWGVQFHPEALGGTAQDWVDEDRQSIHDLGLEEAVLVGDVLAAEPRLGAVWLPIADRFAEVAQLSAAQAA